MSFIDSIFEKFNRKRIIPDDETGPVVLVRYFMLFKDKPRNLNTNIKERDVPFNIFIHKICDDDPRYLHDHPWNYFTIILKGGYWEYSDPEIYHPTDADEIPKWKGPGSFSFNKATSFHRLVLNDNIPCWTLFIRFRKIREWGFNINGKWIPHKQYLKQLE